MMTLVIMELPVTDNQNWDMLWTNARLATMTEGYGVVENGAVGIKNSRIAWVGDMKTLSGSARKTHDAKGAWITPGLIDCHTHLVYGGNRAGEFAQRLAGKSYADIAKEGGGILSTVKATRAASEDELFAVSEKRLRPFLQEGVTTIEIKSGYGLDTKNEMKMLRVARKLGSTYPVTVRTTFLGAHTVPPEFKGKADAYIDYICNDTLPAVAREKLADAVDGFCETIAFSPAQIAKVFEAAKKHGLAVKLHAEQLSDQGGAELAAWNQALSADHLEFVSEDGVKAMAKAGTVAVLLPGAFYMLKETHKPPVALLREQGVPIAIASDCNPGTSPVNSLLLMLNMGCLLFGLTPEEALAGVTKNAARALGLSEVGTLEVGKIADMAIWDITHPVELSYRLGYNPCLGTVKQGIFHARHHA
jgi:imidazolonepropionase